jgi:amino acid permease
MWNYLHYYFLFIYFIKKLNQNEYENENENEDWNTPFILFSRVCIYLSIILRVLNLNIKSFLVIFITIIKPLCLWFPRILIQTVHVKKIWSNLTIIVKDWC